MTKSPKGWDAIEADTQPNRLRIAAFECAAWGLAIVLYVATCRVVIWALGV